MLNNELSNYVKEFQDGNKEIFEKIYNMTNNQLFNVLYSFTNDEQLSYDLMQETYITFYTKAESINNAESIQKWLTVVAINKAKRYLQTKKKDVLVSEENENIFENQEELDEEFLPQQILDSKEKQKIIKDIIDNISLEQKTAVYLYYFNEMSLSEVAQEMGCSEGTVKSRLNYARKKIKIEVDSWEKKGTKLYTTGIPILILILKNQMQEANAMSTNRAKNILKNITESNLSTSILANTNNIHKLFNYKIVSALIAGGIAVSIFVGFQEVKEKNDINVKEITTIQTKDKEKSSNDIVEISKKDNLENDNNKIAYISYDELEINSAGDIKSINNYVQVKDLSNDRCIEILNADGLTNKEDILYVNGKQIDITLEDDGTVSTGYEPCSDATYIAFKEFTDSGIVSVEGDNSEIINLKVNQDLKNISFTEVAEGETTVNVIDSSGKTGTLKVNVSADKDGILNSEYDIDICK